MPLDDPQTSLNLIIETRFDKGDNQLKNGIYVGAPGGHYAITLHYVNIAKNIKQPRSEFLI